MDTLTQKSTTYDVVNNQLSGVGNYSDGTDFPVLNESVENLFTEVESNAASMCIGGDKLPQTKEVITEIEKIDLLLNNKSDFELSDEEIKLLKTHPYMEFIPRMTTTEEEDLLEDVEANGFVDFITITKDMEIIDGRTRIELYKRGCIPHKPKFIYFQNDENDVLDFIMSKNISRRNLTQGQKAISALILNDILKKENKISRKMQAFKDTVQWLDDEENANENGINSRKQAAKFFGISSSYIGKAKAVKENDRILFLKVHAGEESLEKAYLQIKLKKAIPPSKSIIEDFENEYGETEGIVKPLINLLANLGIPENDAQKMILHKFNKEQDEYLKWEKKSDDAKFEIYLQAFKTFMKNQLPDTNEYSAFETRINPMQDKRKDIRKNLNLAEKIVALKLLSTDEEKEYLEICINTIDREICRHSGKQMINDIIIKFIEEIWECSNAKES